jgi:guanylate cyclase
MESTGEPMRIQMSETSGRALLAAGNWECEPRGEVLVKGKGEMNTFWLIGRRDKIFFDDNLNAHASRERLSAITFLPRINSDYSTVQDKFE